jgi:hypothetical protein
MKLIDFIGSEVKYDPDGIFISSRDANGDFVRICDIRSWGDISNIFQVWESPKHLQKAVDFQDSLGEFIAKAIQEKIYRETEHIELVPAFVELKENCGYDGIWSLQSILEQSVKSFEFYKKHFNEDHHGWEERECGLRMLRQFRKDYMEIKKKEMCK